MEAEHAGERVDDAIVCRDARRGLCTASNEKRPGKAEGVGDSESECGRHSAAITVILASSSIGDVRTGIRMPTSWW